MASFLKHALLGCAVGFVVALAGWLISWLGSDAAQQLHTLWLALGVGCGAGVIAGSASAFLRSNSVAAKMPKASEDIEKLKKQLRQQKDAVRRWKRKSKRRHPLERGRLLARVTPNLHWHSMSRALVNLLRGKFVGNSMLPLVHAEDVPAVDQAFNQAATERGVQFVLCRLLCFDPSQVKEASTYGDDTSLLPEFKPESFVHVQMAIWAKRAPTGKVAHYLCRFVDMTGVIQDKDSELRVARKMLARAKKRVWTLGQDLHRLKLSYRELYQHAPVMYFSLDSQGKLVTFNDTLLETLGFDRRDLQGQNYTALLAPATSKDYVTIARNIPSQVGESETKWRKKNGAAFDVWIHTVAVYDEAGNFVRHRNAALDLSEKNRLANELRSRGDELERTNQRLRTINSELEAFTHVVSHDLKEPLRTLQAYSHLLAEEHAAQLGPDGFQYVNHLIRASRRLGALIDELLKLSQAGHITHAPKAFNLNEIVATVRQDLVDLIQRKEAIVLSEGSLPDVVGDPVRITQLIANLVANGLKYNQNPSPKITIGVAANGDDSGRTTIYVRDNGIGIDPAFHQQVFGIFRRLHQADEFEGTGAGLAICKKIVEGHGGKIWVESQPRAGSTFFFTLPRAGAVKAPLAGGGASAPKADNGPASNRRRPTQLAEGSNGQPPRLVVVDDQSDVGLIIRKLGARDGLAITWFPTAEEAWEHLQKNDADLLLFDVNLPGISGIDLCRRIRTLPHLAETPVAMFTPDSDAEKLEELRAAGADFFLTKDLLCEPAAWQHKMQELVAQIREPAAN